MHQTPDLSVNGKYVIIRADQAWCYHQGVIKVLT